MKLRINVPADSAIAPDDPEILQAADNTAAQKASAWTAPTYVGYEDGAHVFEVDAVPRAPGVTTANIAPALMPSRIV
jgi:hypothetical protein